MLINLKLPKKAGLFITGTDICTGKTLIAGAIAKILTDKGIKVGVFKPIATGCRGQWEGLLGRETDFLAHCANSNLPLPLINPVGYFTEAVPFVCAAHEARPIDFDKIASAYKHICEICDLIIVEGAGGVRVPLTGKFDLLDLAAEFNLPTVIITQPSLGMINHTLMTIDCIRSVNLKIAGIVINAYDGTKETITTNTAGQVIARFSRVNILSEVPFDETVNIKEQHLGEIIPGALTHCDWERLARL